MKKLIFNPWIILLLSISIFFSSCEDDNDSVSGIFSNGVFITNEGNYGLGNGSVSFYSYAGDTVSNDIFQTINSRALGDVIQSSTIHNDKVYIVANGSGKIEVVTRHDFKQYGVITDLTLPRYFIGIDKNKGYVSEWGDGMGTSIKVIDLETLSLTKSITVGTGPEHMVYHNSYVYVANSGGYINDNTVSVIDPSNDEVIKTITLDGDSPRDFAVDANGDLWVLCYGYITYNQDYSIATETASKLIRINTSTNEVAQTIVISETDHPSVLESSRNGNNVFYGGGYGFHGIYKMSITDTQTPSTPLIDKAFYGFSVNSETGNIFACDAGYFTANGTLYRYEANGSKLGSYGVGIGPNGTSAKRSNQL